MDWAVCQTGHRPSVTDLLSLFWRVPFRRTGPVQFPLTAADLTHQQGVISSSLCLSVIANPSMQHQSRSCSFVKFPSRTMESVLGKLSFAAYLQSGSSREPKSSPSPGDCVVSLVLPVQPCLQGVTTLRYSAHFFHLGQHACSQH